MNTLLDAIDKAIMGHARLVLARYDDIDQSPSDATLSVDRYGWSASVTVRLQGSRKRPCRISSHGTTPEDAVRALAESLDSWVVVW